jgi:hypothetical protein
MGECGKAISSNENEFGLIALSDFPYCPYRFVARYAFFPKQRV